jgi:pimeloyl-ACP methyl ester carboxylesterase
MGGAISLSTTLQYPDRVAGLGLVATGARLRVTPSLLDTIRQDPESAVRAICTSAFGPEVPAKMLRMGMRQMASVPANVLLGDFEACDDFDVMGRLPEIAVPTLVLCGTRDALTPPKYSTHLRDHIPGARICLVQGSGHMVMLEQPSEVSRALQIFVDSL